MLTWRGRLLRMTLALVFFLVTLETLLRVLAVQLPPNIGNEVVRSYSCERGGLYFRDAPSNLNFCFPNDSRRAVFNGRSWHHQTDPKGFRNPPDCPSQTILLGDSFIYGHGVDESQTAAAVLRRDYHWPVYNLARQGDSLPQEYLLFRLYAKKLQARRVILFVFGNDFWDIKALHTPEEMRDPPELRPHCAEELAQRLSRPEERHIDGDWLSSLYTVRLFRVLWRIWTTPPRPPLPAAEEKEDFQLASAYYETVFSDLARRCRQQQIDLQVVFIEVETGSKHWLRTQKELGAFLESLCARQKVPFTTTHSLLVGHPELTLPGDGHLNPAGHKALADFLAQRLKPLP